ncbi:hypothetical protein A0J61_02994 [Choanephora cucurbitarum]|uniref:Uncharacterized protein n=1 Tax=Choanephora cucurbitarum TaxID=101091 RepID=A0A1C7NIL0_9FUNG|nr:hypothetical protein A0J61_02994 [Choanephora cucurbitarum]
MRLMIHFLMPYSNLVLLKTRAHEYPPHKKETVTLSGLCFNLNHLHLDRMISFYLESQLNRIWSYTYSGVSLLEKSKTQEGSEACQSIMGKKYDNYPM